MEESTEQFSFTDFFDPSFQHLILARMLRDEHFLARVQALLKPKYFATESLSHLCEALFEYYKEYRKLPPLESVRIAYSAKVDGEGTREQYSQLLDILAGISDEDIDPKFLDDEFLWFCQRAEAAEIVVTAQRDLKQFDIEQLTKQLEKVLQMPALFSNLGISLKNDWRGVFKREEKPIFQCGLTGIDYALRGGARAGELVSFMAPLKTGKSLVLGNLAVGLATMGHLVSLISLEMYEDDYRDRLLGSLAQRPSNFIHKYPEELEEVMGQVAIITEGDLILQHFPPGITPISSIEAYMHMLYAKYGRYPLLVIDYADKIAWEGKDEWRGLRETYTGLRNLGRKYGVPVFTASQTNASGFKAEQLDATHQSGSTQKGFEVDVMFGILQNELDYSCNRFMLESFLNRNERKDLVSYWTVAYDQGRIQEVSQDVFFSLTPGSGFLEKRDARKQEREKYDLDQAKGRKTRLVAQLQQVAKSLG